MMKWVKKTWIFIFVVLAIGMQGMGNLEIKTSDGTLHGSLAKAKGHPGEVIVLIAGSGPTDRNGNSLVLSGRMDGFLQLSRALNKEGYSVFRYDKRTAGKSRDSFGKEKPIFDQEIYFDDFVQDAILVVETMREIGYEKVHMIGHSQGALLALRVAQTGQVDSVVHLSGPGVPIDQVFLRQLESLPKDLYKEAEHAFQKMRNGEDVGAVSQELEPYFSDQTIPFLLNWMQYDPVEEAVLVDVPLFFVGGDADTQVLGSNLKIFEEKIPGVQSRLIPNMNHVLKRVESERENQQSYQDPSYPLDPILVESITGFLNRT
jgi:hypothetical protein